MAAFPVLKAVIQEVERCYLPAPVIPKMTAKDIDFMGYHLRGGVPVMHLHGLAHFEAARYPDPFVFNPGRWMDDSPATRANAFGGGIHLCLGMGVTRLYVPLILGMIAADYRWTSDDKPTLIAQASGLDYAPLTTEYRSVLSPLLRL